MFATLLGALPDPPDPPDPPGATVDDRVLAAIRAQEEAGLEPITDGRLRLAWSDGIPHEDEVVAAWRFAAAATDRAVKQALPGPYSIARKARTRRQGAMAVEAASRLRNVVEALAAAGCPLIEIEEDEAQAIGADEVERGLFREAHRRLAEGVGGTHLSLSIVGGSAWDAGVETVLDAPYASLAVDLIAGPDNWNLVTRLPRDRGVIVGALPAVDSPADSKEVLLWAVRYAASSGARGLERTGLGSAGSWANLTWAAAVRKMERLGTAARLAATGGGENLARALDPRAVDARSAALGRVEPRRGRARRP